MREWILVAGDRPEDGRNITASLVNKMGAKITEIEKHEATGDEKHNDEEITESLTNRQEIQSQDKITNKKKTKTKGRKKITG